MLTGILAPMPEEIELILQEMKVESITESGRRKFYKGTLNGRPCVAALSRIGKVASAVTAAAMIEKFNINQLIVTGVAGGIASHLQLGDIVVATETVQHDLDTRPIFPQYEAPLLHKSFFECSPELVTKTVNSCKEFLQTEFHKFISPEDIQTFSLQNPKIYAGQLCCGDQFIRSDEQLQTIRNGLPEVLCVEMEGGAVGQVCYEYGIPYVVVRTISDSADHHAPVNFTKYIENVAKYYTLGIIHKLMEKIDR